MKTPSRQPELKQQSPKLSFNWQYVFLVVSLFTVETAFAQAEREGEAPFVTVPTTFLSFLTNPPPIEDAEFEIIFQPELTSASLAEVKSMPGLPNAKSLPTARPEGAAIGQNPCWLRLEKTNYILNRPAMDGYSGSFGSTQWALVGNWIKLVDRANNAPEDNWSFQMATSHAAVRKLLNLGMAPMVPNSMQIGTTQNSFIAKCERNLLDSTPEVGDLFIQLHFANGVPATATTKDEWGDERRIIYSYQSDFYEGRLPIAFTVEDLNPDGEGTSSKLYSVRIKKLEFSATPIGITEFDPRIVLKGKYKISIVESNNLAYGVTRYGKMQPVISAAEADQRMSILKERKLSQQHPIGTALLRFLLTAAIIVPPIIILVQQYRKNKNIQ